MKYDIFISYRREGGDNLAQLLYDRLTQRGYSVFLDIESLNSGKFDEKLLSVIEDAKDVIVVLSPNSLERCKNEGDWVYRELQHAITCQKNIVPIMMKHFEWPEELPEGIEELRNYNAVIDNKDYFDAVLDKFETLLISKPMAGRNKIKTIIKKNNEKKLVFKERVKRRKKLILISALCVLAVVGLFAGLKLKENQTRTSSENRVKISLTAHEEMSAAEYYDAVDVIKERIEILADGSEYTVEENKASLDISVPLDVFHDCEISNILESYIVCPTEMYLSEYGKENEEDYQFHIERSDIEKIEIAEGLPEGVSMEDIFWSGEDFTEDKDVKHLIITIKEDVAKEAKAWMDEKGWESFKLYHDVEELGLYRYYDLYHLFEGNNQFYIVDSSPYENFLNLIAYNYSNENFEHYFLYSVQMPVKWEYENETENQETYVKWGENQCNIDEVVGDDFARYDFTTYRDELSEGEYKDVVNSLKKRMDTLGVPYAFGFFGNDDGAYNFSIKLDVRYLNNMLFDLLVMPRYDLVVKSTWHEVLNAYDIDKMEVVANGQGNYQLEITPKSGWMENDLVILNDVLTADDTIHLMDAPAFLDASKWEECFDGNKFVFDSMSSMALEQITEEEKYVLDLLKVAAEDETVLPLYNNTAIYFDKEGLTFSEVEHIIPNSTQSSNRKEELEEILDSLCEGLEYRTQVSETGQEVSCTIAMPDSKTWSSDANELFKAIYSQCGFLTGNTEEISIYIYQNEYSKVSYMSHVDYMSHQMSLTLYYDNLPEDDENAFDRLVNEDEFYRQFYYMDSNKKEDGNLSFKTEY